MIQSWQESCFYRYYEYLYSKTTT